MTVHVIDREQDGQMLLGFAAVECYGRPRQPVPPAAPPRPAWHRTSPLSLQAASDVQPRAGTRRAAVLDYIRQRGRTGATRDEIAAGLDLPIQSVCNPVRQLLDVGLVTETTATRLTRHGSAAAVLIAAHRSEPSETEGRHL